MRAPFLITFLLPETELNHITDSAKHFEIFLRNDNADSPCNRAVQINILDVQIFERRRLIDLLPQIRSRQIFNGLNHPFFIPSHNTYL